MLKFGERDSLPKNIEIRCDLVDAEVAINLLTEIVNTNLDFPQDV
jgi:hypothetical protein